MARKQRTSKKMSLALTIAADPAMVARCAEFLRELGARSSSSTYASQIVKYERIVRGAGVDPWPLTLDKLELFIAVSIAAGYQTTDDDVSVLNQEGRKRELYSLSKLDENYVASLLASLKRKGCFSHSQKKPLFRNQILSLSSIDSKAKLLLAFYFGLRKSECSHIGSSIKLLWGKNSIGLDLRAAQLKSNHTQAIRCRCLCSSNSVSSNCLHFYRSILDRVTNGFDLQSLLNNNFESYSGSSHSLRVGCLLTLLEQSKRLCSMSSLSVTSHIRWQNSIMVGYYSRMAGLWEIPKSDSEECFI